MKNFVKFTLGSTLALLFLLTFKACQSETSENRSNSAIDPPKQIVTISAAKSYYDNYSQRRVPLIQRYEDSINRRTAQDTLVLQEDGTQKVQASVAAPVKFDVARYVYYDYKTIKQYMAFIEQQAAAAKVDISTLRFYFSNYPDSTGYVHPRQNSIMISPALRKGDREFLFYINNTDRENPKPVLLTDSFKPSKVQLSATDMDTQKVYAGIFTNGTNAAPVVLPPFNGGQSLTMNRGGGIPPPYHEN